VGIFDIFGRKKSEPSANARFDRKHKFVVRRMRDFEGMDAYSIENSANRERIEVSRLHFDHFRHQLRLACDSEEERSDKGELDFTIEFKGEILFKIRTIANDPPTIEIREGKAISGTSRKLVMETAALPTLVETLFDDGLKHTNEALNLITAYHKLFQFTFTEGSDSINSDLALRKDVLCVIDNYHPPAIRKSGSIFKPDATADEGTDKIRTPRNFIAEKKSEKALFKSRLAERSGNGSYQIDYSKLLAADDSSPVVLGVDSAEGGRKSGKATTPESCFSLPLLANELRNYQGQPIRCELSNDEIQKFRSEFLGNREQELFIGIEIMDAVYKQNGKLLTFNFPLYYAKVNVTESNRSVIIELAEGDKLYLNHIGLANLVVNHGSFSAGRDPLESFLQTLLAQKIEVRGRLVPFRLTRQLPVPEEIFDKNRQILLGQPDEGGKGGILGALKLLGIECDLESVFVYKSSKTSSPLTAALEDDLDLILKVALDRPKRFYTSLLGKFLTPGQGRTQERRQPFCDVPWIPGALPGATRRLLKRLNEHDLVLLEGPPGTGKTFTIFNLFLHCICSGKRLLIVSDQSAAIHALIEKFEDYLYGNERGTSKQKGIEALWKTAIKVIDQVPKSDGSLTQWCQSLKNMLGVENPKEFDWPAEDLEIPSKIRAIDTEISKIKQTIQKVMEKRTGPNALEGTAVAAKRDHDYTVDDIVGLREILDVLKFGKMDRRWHLLAQFATDRRMLNSTEWGPLAGLFEFPQLIELGSIQKIKTIVSYLNGIIAQRPRSSSKLKLLLQSSPDARLTKLLIQTYERCFPASKYKFVRTIRKLMSYVSHPMNRYLLPLIELFSRQQELIETALREGPHSGAQWQKLHKSLIGDTSKKRIPVVLEIARNGLLQDARSDTPTNKSSCIQSMLEKIARLQEQRDDLVRARLVGKLGTMARDIFATDQNKTTNVLTTMASQLEALKGYQSLDAGKASLKDFQETLAKFFPIVVCRKQAVSFLFPCTEQSFDLVIVDEATQCRVDDALPLLFRGTRLMVVGDEKQTVLAKNSVVDDYLFEEFALEEHLRTTQAQGMKGGGSHIFGLVKGIKQASVMLDEHYRCPPQIIEFSNRYVYGNELKVMQWVPAESPASVYVDFSEKKHGGSLRQDSGQYKGIETEMVDRFLDYVAREVKNLEKELGRRIDVETEVALCYFLLKNEPYVKRMKPEFLRKLGRGNEVLDGAGAALQGKERNFIFYLWDITRGNMLAFKQGDEPDKRKGELNVLMSRPKIRAYHYLHGEFDKVDHSKATIADYLWRRFHQQSEQQARVEFQPRRTPPDPNLPVWQRSSGQLIENLVCRYLPLGPSPVKNTRPAKGDIKVQYSVAVGDPKHVVDLMLTPAKSKTKKSVSLGLVDLAGFEVAKDCAQEVVDYYFQLKRAVPKLAPVFGFVHEFADLKSPVGKVITNKLGNSDDDIEKAG
jgi:hypothetical protein